MTRSLTLLLATLGGLGCAENVLGPSAPPFGEAELNVLYVGNSLTEWNDLPELVGRVADAAGRTYAFRSLLTGGFSLEDHWNAGADDVVRELGADVVVLQQGPSSVGTNPQHLRRWTGTFAPVIEEAGGRPALLMVWPERGRVEAFDVVRESYRGAAQAVDGIFIPAGDAWRAVWERDPSIELYGPDGFHPSARGSFVAALTVFEVLYGEDVRTLPALVVEADEAEVLYEAVHAAVEGIAPPGTEGIGDSAIQIRPRTPQR